MGFINGQTLQGWKVFTFSWTLILSALNCDFTLMHVHLWPLLFVKILAVCLLWTAWQQRLKAKVGRDTETQTGITCNRGPQQTQLGAIVVIWCASYRWFPLQDISPDCPVLHRFRRLKYILFSTEAKRFKICFKSCNTLFVYKVIKGEQRMPWRNTVKKLLCSSWWHQMLVSTPTLFALNEYFIWNSPFISGQSKKYTIPQ